MKSIHTKAITLFIVLTRHTEAAVFPNLVQTSSVVLAWGGLALLDVPLTEAARVANRALTVVGPVRVDTVTAVLAGAVLGWKYKKKV